MYISDRIVFVFEVVERRLTDLSTELIVLDFSRYMLIVNSPSYNPLPIKSKRRERIPWEGEFTIVMRVRETGVNSVLRQFLVQ